jgi:hypothetical protein
MTVTGPKIQPHPPAAADRYCRIFPELSAATQQKMSRRVLESLASSMCRKQTPIPVNLIQGHAPPAIAVTYFGQFVDHDLTFDSTPLREAGSCAPIYTINNRTPWLDLDHLYGDGPRSSRHGHLYESDDASFRIGHSAFGGEPFDVPFTVDGRPGLVDERNGENVIIRQIHAMFLKLHNVAVRELTMDLPPRERFDCARDRVRWQYQWLVRNWYLREICHPEIYELVIEKGDRRIDWSNTGFAIPVEFAVGAFRFGHSMVRREYRLNSLPLEKGGSGVIPLQDLFGAKNSGPLGPELKIDWSLLSNNTAMSIDTALVEPLFQLPDDHVNVVERTRIQLLGERIDLYARSSLPHPQNALAFRTLLRAAAMCVPTGQQAREALGEDAIANVSPQYQVNPWAALRAADLADETPLWYYILLEAQLDPGIPGTRSGFGATLGKLGSRIVGEVIEGSLLLDPTSFLRRGWKPEKWPTPDGKQIQVKSLKDVARIAAV